jgi:hypothetical protein
MGWEAIAFEADNEPNEIGLIGNPEILKAFQQAFKNVIKITGRADMMLQYGGILLWDCLEMLERSTELFPYETVWTPEQVKKINDEANWEFEFLPDQATAYWSALRFLEVCGRYNLGIKFH